MFKKVIQNKGSFSAIDESGRKVTIIESISFIFLVQPNEEDNRVLYSPIKYSNHLILEEIERFLRGVDHNGEIIDAIVIRYGWMDKRLNKLSFISLKDLMAKGKDMSGTDRRKVAAICKQLSMSTKNII
jgi:hypothetical protein